MKIKKAYQFSLLLLVWILVPSCVKDKLSNCLPAETAVNLKFHLAVNSEDGNDINLNDVTYLDVYLFDKETGTFYKHFRDEDPQLQDKTYRLKIMAAPNTYDIIVWGNTNNNDYSYLPLLPFVENQTTLSE
ncbi:MAG: FimB/Mfa2 family fimbrial subunit, partial [Bacteroides sp.]